MLSLRIEHWERIRVYCPEECIPEDCPGRKPVLTHADNLYDATSAQLSFDYYMIEARPENLVAFTPNDSGILDEALAGGVVLRLYSMAKSSLGSLGMLRREFLGFAQLVAMVILLRQF